MLCTLLYKQTRTLCVLQYLTFFIHNFLGIVFQKGVFPDLLATSGDYLRVWRVGDTETRLECLLNNVSINPCIFIIRPKSCLFPVTLP